MNVSGTQGLEFRSTGTATVTAPLIQVNSLLAARTGTTDLGTTVITSAPVGTFVAGLREHRLTGTTDLNTTTAPDLTNYNGIQLAPRFAESNVATGAAGIQAFGDNTTYIYSGQIFDADGIFTFVENVDDDTQIKVNGIEILLNKDTVGGQSSASVATNSGSTVGLSAAGAPIPGGNQISGPTTVNFGASPTGNGFYPVEIRVQNGTGGVGPTINNLNGFQAFFGLSLSSTAATNATGFGFERPVDNGTMNLFRTDTITKATSW